jgi:hypothetical protein
MEHAGWHRSRGGLAAARALLGALLVAVGLGAASRPAAAVPAARPHAYLIPVPPGDSAPPAVASLVADIQAEHPAGVDRLVVLIHGFGTSLALARRQYDEVAARLQRAMRGDPATAVVGVFWASDPGPLGTWMGRAVAHRVTGIFGAEPGVRDPYSTVAWRAQGVGRRALRQILFGLQDAFPGAGVHLVTHSLGAQVAMNALAPDLIQDRQDTGPAHEPERELRVASAFLTGADLDADLFVAGGRAAAASAALDRARLWWFTAPRPGRVDRVLWLRGVHVGEPAVGNTGPRFSASESESLLEGGRLVLDMGRVPANHWFVAYLSAARLRAIAGAIRYLEGRDFTAVAAAGPAAAGPEPAPSPPGAGPGTRLLAAVDAVRAAPATAAALRPYLAYPALTVRLYAAWRLGTLDAEEGPAPELTLPRARAAIAAAREEVGE